MCFRVMEPAARVERSCARSCGERRKIVEEGLANIDEEPVLLHLTMAYRHQKEFERLLHTINDDECRAEATQIIRSLVDQMSLLLTRMAAICRLI